MESRIPEEEKQPSSLREYEVLRTISVDQNEEVYEVRKMDSTDVSLII